MSLDWLEDEINNTPDIAPVPDGTYRLRLSRLSLMTQDEAKGGKQFLMASIDFPEVPTAEEMGIFVSFLPAKEEECRTDEERKASAKAKNDIKKFFSAFGIPLSMVREFDESQERPTLKAAEGLETQAVVGLRPSKRNEGQMENYVKQWLPK